MLNEAGPIYTAFLDGKDYDNSTRSCIVEVVSKMGDAYSTADRPGMLLGMIQSGKTRTYLGAIALAFDNGYEVAIVLTKGTNALTQQTVSRLQEEFDSLIAFDEVDVFDIMQIRGTGLNRYQLQKRLIIVCKKEDDNLRHLQTLLFETCPDLASRRTLIVDDEADFASVSFRKQDNTICSGAIAGSINSIRSRLPKDSSFLQVTATPYSLYLQPRNEAVLDGTVFKPTRPSFTVLVPTHDKYVGGDYYFQDSEEPGSVAWSLHVKIDPREMDRLRRPDRRTCKPEEILTDRKVEGLRRAVITFMVGAVIRRLQQRMAGIMPVAKYSFVVHTDVSKKTHDWQKLLLDSLVDKIKEVLATNPVALDPLVQEAYEDLKVSLAAYRRVNQEAQPLPRIEEVVQEVRDTFDYLHIAVVNSNNDVANLLDGRSGQLKLTSPYTIFVGGLILDRGLTIENMIGFFYGRNPKSFQQDTVLQHSRMYGARSRDDLPVTRFYTTERIYEIMKSIHEFDTALREEIEKFGDDAGVVFIERDLQNRVRACSPNKILISRTTTLKPYKRLLPIGFQTGYNSHIQQDVRAIDGLLPHGEPTDPFLIDLAQAHEIVDLAGKTLKFSNADYAGQVPGPEFFRELGYSWDMDAFKAALSYASLSSSDPTHQGKVWCLVRRNRNNLRIRPDSGRFTNAPDTSHVEGVIAKSWAKDIPILMLFRQTGSRDLGWLGAPFWWPVAYMPADCRVSVYASETADV